MMRCTRFQFMALALAVMAMLYIASGCSGGGAAISDNTNPPTPSPATTLQASATSGAAPLAVQFTASVANFAAGTMSYDYDFNGDGVYEVENAGTTPPTQTFTIPGVYHIVLRVRSSNGLWASTMVLINVGPAGSVPATAVNLCPVVRVAAYPSTAAINQKIALDGSGSYDPEGAIASYAWDTNNDGIYELLNSTANPPPITFTTSGAHIVALRVTDTSGLAAVSTCRVTVNSGGQDVPIIDQPPTAWLMVFPDRGAAPLPVNLDASGSWAADGSALTFDWDLDGDGVYETLAGQKLVSHTYATAGTYTVRMRVTDAKHLNATKSQVITVTPGQEQIHAQLYVYPTTGTAPLTVTLDANGSWAIDGSALTYEYDPEGDGTYLPATANKLVTTIYASAGTYHPRLRITDTKSRTATADGAVVAVSPAANVAPVARLTANPARGAVPLTVQLDASTSTDADGAIVRYDWDMNGDNAYEIVNAGARPATLLFTVAGTYTVNVKVIDNSGLSSTAAVVITADPQGSTNAPVARLTANPTSGTAPLSVQLDASTSTDADGTIVRYDWDMNGDNSFEITNAGAKPAVLLFPVAGNYTVNVKVIDNSALFSTASVAIIVNPPAGDHVPVAKLVAVPSSGSSPLAVNFDATSSTDADNDIATYMFDFQSDGSYDTVNTTGKASFTYSADGNYTAKVHVLDVKDHSSSATVQISVGKQADGPTVIVIATPAVGPAPLAVTFYAGYSLSIGSAIKSFDWDLNNDGTFELLDAGPEQTTTFTTVGTSTIKVRVTDYKDRQATGQCLVIVTS